MSTIAKYLAHKAELEQANEWVMRAHQPGRKISLKPIEAAITDGVNSPVPMPPLLAAHFSKEIYNSAYRMASQALESLKEEGRELAKAARAEAQEILNITAEP